MSDREDFLAALTEESTFGFNEVMKRHYAPDDLFNVAEILETLSKDQVNCMWKDLFRLCSTALQSSDGEQGLQGEIDLLEAIQTLQDLATVALHFVSLDKPVVTNELFQIVSVLHSILLSLPEDAAKLQNDISKLCEYWFLADFTCKEELVSNTVIYLLARTHLQLPTKSDLKRVWDMRQSFNLLDFEDESSDGLKVLLERCLMLPLYLSTDMGRKILVFLFTLHPSIVEHFHCAIKNAIPRCQISFLDAFSEIYYQAWKGANASNKEKIEKFCIQDLMYCAVHAKKTLFAKIEKILAYIHKQKSQSNVDEMLYRLYQPILWRALKASNPLVRANAASLLIDVFPLLDSSAGVIESDQQRQMQLDSIANLLQDECPLVRVIAIQGVCKICSYYWEYIPATTIKGFFTKLTDELAFDSSSTDVRAAVFKGLKFIINNRLSHSLIKNMIPNLRDLIHDHSEKVRLAFLELLLAFKGLRSIKFWSIVPLQHLLARLEVETSTNCIKIIVKLLVNSYLPSKGNPAIQLASCSELMWTSRGAARTFFKFAHSSASFKIIANFIKLITNCILGSARGPLAQTGNENSDTNIDSDENGTVGGKDNGTTDDSSNIWNDVNETEIDFTDKKLLATMLDVLVISWLSIKGKLDKAGNATLKEKLINTLTEAVPVFLENFKDGEARAAVIVLASNLPPAPQISELCLDALHSLPVDAGPNEFSHIVQYLCVVGFAPNVLDHLHQGIKHGLNEHDGPQRKVARKKGNGGKTDGGYRNAVNILSWALGQSAAREAILKQKDKCYKLHELLKSSMDCLEVSIQDMKRRRNSAPKQKEDFLADCLSLSCRIAIHLNGQKGDLFEQSRDFVEEFQHVFCWMERILLPEVDNYGGSSLDDAASKFLDSNKGRKRQSCDDTTQNLGSFILKLLQNQLIITSEVIRLGVGSVSFLDFATGFISRVASHASSVYILPDVMRVSCDMCQARSSSMEQVSGRDDPAIKIMASCFKNIQLAESQFPGLDSTQVLSAIKSFFTEIIKTRFCSQAAFLPSDASIISTVLSIVVDDIAIYLNENQHLTKFDGLDDLPTVAYFVTNVLLKSKQFQRSLFEEILFYSTEKEGSDELKMSSLVYLVDVLVRFGTRSDKDDLLMKTVEELQKNFKASQEARKMTEETALDHISILPGALNLLAGLVRERSENAN